MAELARDALTDRIYEAAIVPELWPSLLGDVVQATESVGLGLFVTNARHVTRWTASTGFEEVMAEWAQGGWQAKCTRPARMFALNRAGWVTEQDVFAPGEIEQEPDYQGFFRPRGLGHAAGTGVVLPSGDLGVFDLERSFEAGPFGPDQLRFLDGLRPDLSRAVLMAARLELERARATVALLEDIGLPAAVIGHGTRIFAANPLLEAMKGQVAFAAFDRLRFAHEPAEALFQTAVAALSSGRAAGGASFPLPAADGDPPAVAHLLPVRGAAQDLFGRGLAVLVVTPLAGATAPNADILAGLFDLSPAEARVARGLVAGKTLEEIAADAKVAWSTVRNQLRAVMAKTGVRRQAELVALLATPAGLNQPK